MAQRWNTDDEHTSVQVPNATPPPVLSDPTKSNPPLDPEIEALLDETWAEYAEAYRYLGSH
jgi:hypothetical protein